MNTNNREREKKRRVKVNMIETVSNVGKTVNVSVIASDEEEKIESLQADEKSSEDEKTMETNGLFQHLPTFYSDSDEEEATRSGLAKKVRLRSSAYSVEPKMNQIIPRLYISDDVTARNKPALAKYKITHILNLTTNIPNKFEPDIKYLKIGNLQNSFIYFLKQSLLPSIDI